MMRRLAILATAFCLISCVKSSSEKMDPKEGVILPGANQLNELLPLLQQKKVGLCVNHTSLVNGVHLVDTLSQHGIDIERIFTPEHGYRGTADAGEVVENDTIEAIEVVSLYGKNKKPNKEQLKGLDILVLDLQDVGTRFYTYISTMHYVMEACAENDLKLIILDRPNPNDFIDGPLLDTAFQSFVGMHEIPVVHGLTIGELASMINGEGWLDSGMKADMDVITIKNWKHGQEYFLPVRPSPNLPNQQAIELYPTLCFFEGTVMSIGRGTDFPFQVVGHPSFPDSGFSFAPNPNFGSKYPKHKGEICFGIDMRKVVPPRQIDIDLIIDLYKEMNDQEFFNSYFNTLAGNDVLQGQIQKGLSSAEIRSSWQPKLDDYKSLREKYLLYDDYE